MINLLSVVLLPHAYACYREEWMREQGRFRLNMRKNFFSERIIKPWPRMVGQWWGHHPLKDLKIMQLWHLETWFSGGLGSVELMVRLNDPKDILQLLKFYDSMKYLYHTSLLHNYILWTSNIVGALFPNGDKTQR